MLCTCYPLDGTIMIVKEVETESTKAHFKTLVFFQYCACTVHIVFVTAAWPNYVKWVIPDTF